MVAALRQRVVAWAVAAVLRCLGGGGLAGWNNSEAFGRSGVPGQDSSGRRWVGGGKECKHTRALRCITMRLVSPFLAIASVLPLSSCVENFESLY